MGQSRIAALCAAAASGSLNYTDHYGEQLLSRPTPGRDDIRFILREDDAQVIEDYPHRRNRCLIWGTTQSGRIGHLVCRNEPDSWVVTAYFPADTEAEKWKDNYRKRR